MHTCGSAVRDKLEEFITAVGMHGEDQEGVSNVQWHRMFCVKYLFVCLCLAFPVLKVGFLSSVWRRCGFPVTLDSWLKSVGSYLMKPEGNGALVWRVSSRCGAL